MFNQRGKSNRGRNMITMMLLASCLCSTNAFITSSSQRPPFVGKYSPSAAAMVQSGVQGNTLAKAPPRLSDEDQKLRLAETVELRRINNMAEEVTSQASKMSVMDFSALAGYGDDVDAYRGAISRGMKAKEELIATNMGLVHFCINEIIGKEKRKNFLNSLSREDLVQEGAIGLSKAINRWDPQIGGKFSTYAMYWVRATILRSIASRDDILRVPEYVLTNVRKVTKAAEKLGIELEGDSKITSSPFKSEIDAYEALAKESGLAENHLFEALRVRNRRMTGGYVAFETWMQKGNNLESDITVHKTVEDDEMSSSLQREHLSTTLAQFLRPKEMEALALRYGLASSDDSQRDLQGKGYLERAEEELFGTTTKQSTMEVARGRWGEAMSFTEVGKNMQVSAEYGRRLCHAAIKKLQQAAAEGKLEYGFLA